MGLHRQITVVLLTFGLALFGVVATAPAHGHSGSQAAAQVVHAVAFDSHAVDEGHHHEDVDHQRSDGHEDAPAEGEQGMHAHAFPQMAPADDVTLAFMPSSRAAVSTSFGQDAVVQRAAAPPLRPPRTIL